MQPETPRIARIAVDVSLPHLDRFFDYSIPAELADQVQVGCRVQVRFSGRLCDGFVVDLADSSPVEKLAPVKRVVSREPVLQPEMRQVLRKVADYYAGVFADVMRLAVPPRHATTEKTHATIKPGQHRAATVIPGYPTGQALLDALTRGDSPRASWVTSAVCASLGDWARGFADLAAATRLGGRASLLLVPDARDLARLQIACDQGLGKGSYVVLHHEAGPSARYRAFLAAERGEVDVVLGTRSASFAPVKNLGLIALWDDGDDLWSDLHAPYPHAREVACIRAAHSHAGLVLAGYSRSAETHQLLERSWLSSLELDRGTTRRIEPVIRVAGDSAIALQRDPTAPLSRLPREVFEVIRAGLARGPVLVQVPRAGGRHALVCQRCREQLRCPHCAGPLSEPSSAGAFMCRWCARPVPRERWRCNNCGSSSVRSNRIGAERTAQELAKAFPQTKLITSNANKIIDHVDDEPALVVCTPGGEPYSDHGFAAGVLLDGDALLQRADLRASEETYRRWTRAVALVRSATEDGVVIVVANPAARAVQALVRRDPAGFAARELIDRREARFPPAVKLIEIQGTPAAVAELLSLVDLPDPTDVLGPVSVANPGGEEHRVLLRCPLSQGKELVGKVKEALGIRSAKKSLSGPVRVRVDPVIIG